MLDTKRSRVTKPTAPRTTSNTKKTRSKTNPIQPTKSPNTTTVKDPHPTQQPSKPTMAPSTTPQDPAPLPPLTNLASSTPSLRRTALTTLLTHLTQPTTGPLTSHQLSHIWRALYVALYMHDSKSALSVQDLARTLGSTVRIFYQRDLRARESRDPEEQQRADDGDGDGDGEEEEGAEWPQSAAWTTAFWEELSREWVGVDQWRVNKVMMLVRFFVGEGFGVAEELAGLKEGGEGDEVEKSNSSGGGEAWKDYIAEVVAVPLERERRVPDGLRMHVLDVWGDEAERVAGGEDVDEEGPEEATKAKRREILEMLLAPVGEVARFRDGEVNLPKNVRTRAKDVLGRV